MSEVRILNGSLEEDGGEIIIRGVLDPATMRFINMAWYQREQGFSQMHTQEIVDAYFAGAKVPDVTIGMRGQRVGSSKNTYALQDKCYCIDGGQRLYAAAIAIQERSDLKISLGVKVFLGTNEDMENEMFCKLGTTQKRVSPSVLLRNRKKKSPGARILVEMNKREGFALKDRIAWDQARSRHELISGYSFARIVGALHAQLAPLRVSQIYELQAGFDKLVEEIGEETLQDNIMKFFEAIDQCWTIRQQSGAARRGSRPHLKPGFLMTLARLMANFPAFWDGRKDFYCSAKFVKRLKGFKLAEFVQTSGATGATASVILYESLRKQLQLAPAEEVDPFKPSEAAE
jgi:hypothetical protein